MKSCRLGTEEDIPDWMNGDMSKMNKKVEPLGRGHRERNEVQYDEEFLDQKFEKVSLLSPLLTLLKYLEDVAIKFSRRRRPRELW